MARGYRYSLGLAFEAIARDNPDGPALKGGDAGDVTYGELDRLANRLAHLLRARGVRRRDVVGIVHTKTTTAYATMLAALKLGAAYVNIDDQNPPPRLAHVFGTAKPRLICGERLSANIITSADAAGATCLDFADDEFGRTVAIQTDASPAESELVLGSDPAYIMYTSGSTGVPKGAVMSHANVLNFGAWAGERFAIEPHDVLSNVNPMYFDNSVFDFYAAVLNGAALAPIARDIVADPPRMLDQLEAAGCTIWFSVPSLLIYLSTLKQLHASRLPDVRAFVFGGEGYPRPELRKLFAAFGARSQLVNVYGPTECTCICSAYDVTAADLEEASGLVTLGPVAPNFAHLIVDDALQPVPAGEPGELCLLGPQVGLGYANDTERTARSFVQNPLNASFSEQMYRTGDLVRLGPDGRSLNFAGRKDNQIKHMGYRIELEEIEAALNALDGVVQAAVLHVAGRRGLKSIVAIVACESARSESDLRDGLAQRLPPYMLPQRFHVRAELPKNPNGKVDRVALAAEFADEGAG